jgi:hypothetical protein
LQGKREIKEGQQDIIKIGIEMGNKREIEKERKMEEMREGDGRERNVER